MLFIILFLVCLAVELSPKINTDNNIKKIAIGFVMVGAIVEYTGRESPFIEIGICAYLAANLITAHLSNPKRRVADK